MIFFTLSLMGGGAASAVLTCLDPEIDLTSAWNEKQERRFANYPRLRTIVEDFDIDPSAVMGLVTLDPEMTRSFTNCAVKSELPLINIVVDDRSLSVVSRRAYLKRCSARHFEPDNSIEGYMLVMDKLYPDFPPGIRIFHGIYGEDSSFDKSLRGDLTEKAIFEVLTNLEVHPMKNLARKLFRRIRESPPSDA